MFTLFTAVKINKFDIKCHFLSNYFFELSLKIGIGQFGMTFKSFEKHQQQPFEIQGFRILNIIQGQPSFGTNKRFYLAPKPSSQYVNKYIKGTYNLSEQSLFEIHVFRSFKFLDSKACFLLPNVKTLGKSWPFWPSFLVHIRQTFSFL